MAFVTCSDIIHCFRRSLSRQYAVDNCRQVNISPIVHSQHVLFYLVPIIPDYLYNLQNATKSFDETYRFLSKNCSNTEIIRQRSYFSRHPVQFRRVLYAHCNWTVDWAMNRTELENKQRTTILESVRRETQRLLVETEMNRERETRTECVCVCVCVKGRQPMIRKYAEAIFSFVFTFESTVYEMC
jgi:hypothetical protein